MSECPYIVSTAEGTTYCRLAETTADEIDRLRECLVQVQNASIDLTQQIARLRDENDRLRDEVAICRDAVESAVDLVTDWANDPENDSDGSQGAARAIRRKLNEAIGKACPALMFEKPDGQRLYGLRWRELKDELARARAELERVTAERDAAHEKMRAVAFDAYDAGFDDGLESCAVNSDGKQYVGNRRELRSAQRGKRTMWNYRASLGQVLVDSGIARAMIDAASREQPAATQKRKDG